MTQNTQEPNVVFDLNLIHKYNKSGPRYTSYPTAVQFSPKLDDERYQQIAQDTNEDPIPRPLSLYFHIPFCDTVCFYCACNKLATKNHALAGPYLEHVYRELAMQSRLFDNDRQVEQLHWGGGTPTFLSHHEIRELMAVTRQNFHLADDSTGEFSIEVDPRETDAETVALLREVGFNRMSIGVQDFDPAVLKAVNRIQPREVTLETLQSARQYGFRSINLDLIYGLPMQTVESFSRTLDEIIDLKPDRLSVFNYAHLPERFKPQRRIQVIDLPSATDKLQILQNTIRQLTDAGYVFIGMDHFARPDDELVQAQREGRLHRNFQGYSTHAGCDLIGFGATSIGMVGDSYSQNLHRIDEYNARIDAGRLAVYHGIELNRDDLIRREVITQLMCHFQIQTDTLSATLGIDFWEYFQREKMALQPMLQDGMIVMSRSGIQVTPSGRLLIRNICMEFDHYLNQPDNITRFSRVI